MADLEVEIREPGADLACHWRDLVCRAPANVFTDPAGLVAARDSGFARPFLLLAWDRTREPARLAGALTLRAHKTPGLPRQHLRSQPHAYACISGPVIDPDYASAVIPAFFAEIALRPDLPKIIHFEYLDGVDPGYNAVRAAMADSGFRSLVLKTGERAFVTRESGVKRSGATRKKLRQDWNRLSASGSVDLVNKRGEEARDALEIFLAMEAASWKGRRRTALLSNEDTAAFVRSFVANLAAAGNASVAILRLDGRPIAAQVLLYAGSRAYTWKTAYDATFSSFSPGTLLIDRLTDLLFAGDKITAIDSCSPTSSSFMNRMWAGRRPTIDLLVELAPRQSVAFLAIAAHARTQAWLAVTRHRLRVRYEAWRRGGAGQDQTRGKGTAAVKVKAR